MSTIIYIISEKLLRKLIANKPGIAHKPIYFSMLHSLRTPAYLSEFCARIPHSAFPDMTPGR
jgi:hypothetical protein